MTFQILSLSGGGYRGLFTIEVLVRLEQRAGRPIGECFDLIAGTSIGGIIAIGLAMGKTAEAIKAEFIMRGEDIFPHRPPAKTRFGKCMELWRLSQRPKYDGIALRATIEAVVGQGTLLGDARTRLLVPAVNMTKGSVQIFKTPHGPHLEVDRHRKAADVAMATSAAPLFFPLAKIESSYFADGGLAANAPDACAVHEAIHFANQERENLRVLSIGTTSTKFGLPTSLGADFGGAKWLANQRLIATVFGVQQQLVDFMVGHSLGNRYLRVDEFPSSEHATDLGLDIATADRRDTLLGLAEGAYQKISAHPLVVEAITHRPIEPEFVRVRRLANEQVHNGSTANLAG